MLSEKIELVAGSYSFLHADCEYSEIYHTRVRPSCILQNVHSYLKEAHAFDASDWLHPSRHRGTPFGRMVVGGTTTDLES